MSVTAAGGFTAAGGWCGIKTDRAPDLALVVADDVVPASGVFTRSRTPAPPVELTRRRLSTGSTRAVVINSGCANAGTGAAGMEDAERMGTTVAASLGCGEEDVLVCSTGPIGGRVPVDRVEAAMPGLVASLSADGGGAAAAGILTTDTVIKEAAVTDGGVTVGGMAKGAGMLRPDMATMLAFLTTDAAVDAGTLSSVLRGATQITFNCLDVDGCQSTNDTAILMASGRAGPVDPDRFGRMVESVCRDLARQMASDAEGAARVVDILIEGAASDEEARCVGRAIADSALVRSSFWGADPNWGRVLAAVGVAGAEIDPNAIRISYEEVTVCAGGVGVPFDEAALVDRLGGDFRLGVAVGAGPGRAEIVTTDLTPEYVRFNGERS